MFEESELRKSLNEDKTKLTVIIPDDQKHQCNPQNFNKLAAFINHQTACHTLRFWAKFQMTRDNWQALGKALAGTDLHVLELQDNYLGKYDHLGTRLIAYLVAELSNNRSLYKLDVHNTKMDRTAISSLAKNLQLRPLWLNVKATQDSEQPSTCHLVDAAVAANRKQFNRTLIAVTQSLLTLPKDLIKIVVGMTFFSGNNHPICNGLTNSIHTAHAIALTKQNQNLSATDSATQHEEDAKEVADSSLVI